MEIFICKNPVKLQKQYKKCMECDLIHDCPLFKNVNNYEVKKMKRIDLIKVILWIIIILSITIFYNYEVFLWIISKSM